MLTIQLVMDAKDTDIFISYRRVDGRDIARTIQLALGKEGFENVFFDYTSMREGMFNEQIITAINNCKDFILVLTPQSMLRCSDPNDWVAKELQTAIEAGCKIIPVQVNDPFNAWPADFPRKFNFIKQLEFLTLRTDEYFSDSIRRLIGWLDSKPTLKQENLDNFTLCVSVDETCDLLVDGVKIQKIKGGKQARLKELTKGKVYNLKFVSLARRDSEINIQYELPGNGQQSDTLAISFVEMREQALRTAEQERIERQQAKEHTRELEGRLSQVAQNYDKAGGLYDDMMMVCRHGKTGFLNVYGFEAVSCEYDDAKDFSGGYATVCKKGKWGLIDKIGQIVLPLFSDTPCLSHKDVSEYFVASKDGHYAVFNILDGVPDSYHYENALVLYNNANVFAVKENSLWKLIDPSGKTSPCALSFKSIKEYYRGYYHCSFISDDSGFEVGICFAVQHPTTGRWGYMNSNLELTVPFVDDGSDEDTDYDNLVIIKTNSRMGLVDIETGEFVIPPIFHNIKNFYDDFFRVSNDATPQCIKIPKNQTIDLNNLYGKLFWENNECKAGICRWFYGGMQGVMDINGSVIVPQLYQMITPEENYKNCDHPYFIAYILKDLKFSWSDRDWLNEASLRVWFNNETSQIHVYSYKGEMLAQLSYNDEEKVREIIAHHINLCENEN